MGWPLRSARMLVIGACLGGCAVIANISSGEGVAPADAGIDGPMSIPSTDGMVSPVETGGGPCAAGGNSADSPTKIHATKVQTPVKIDGDGAEWGCVDRFAFTGGQRVVGLAGGNAVADIAVQWDEANVYFWASVKTASTGDNGAAGRQGNFANDSIHLYLSGPSPNMNYTADDHHLVFDYKNQVADYAIGFRTGLDGIAAVVSPVTNANGTLSFVVEARIESQRIGRPTLKAGDKVRINFQLNDAPNSAGNYRIWFRDVAVCARFTKCDLAGGSEPYCDPRCTGEVELR